MASSSNLDSVLSKNANDLNKELEVSLTYVHPCGTHEFSGRACDEIFQTQVSLLVHSSYISWLNFVSSPYDILDLPVTANESEIKRQYRRKSLMIHPDKFKHDNGLEVGDSRSRLQTERQL